MNHFKGINMDLKLKKDILNFVKSLPNKFPELIHTIKQIEENKGGFFSRNPYGGWILNGKNICGYRNHRVLFSEDNIEIINHSYPDSYKNPKIYYLDLYSKNSLSKKSIKFFEELRKYVDKDSVNFIENKFQEILKEWLEEKIKNEEEIKKIEKERILKLRENIKSNLDFFDKDGNGKLDTIQIKDDFERLVKKHQKTIIDIDINYIQNFVKISNYQKLKRDNLQLIFESISKSKNQENLNELIELLKERIHSYELLVFHSLSMVTCLVENDMFTFYEIYESLDKLKIFKSDHEREVSEKLTNIEFGIYDLMYSIRSMEKSIINELGHLSYVTQHSFKNLSDSVSKELISINSSIKFNNLLTGIQTYQTYKVNQNTKPLRG